ncbi:PDDEXK nuclease domain-containing protein [Almyronema epifaneia]|uniref:YhcG family protein n=1 Tax=Almyronema epifaneia S1 TaxID=2991925 RepID=A0ABW6ILE7_9CYAN
MSELVEGYGALLGEIKQRIRTAQYEALKAVNKELIALYWDIGKLIATRQQGQTWGKSVVEQLSRDLKSEFSGVSGFSSRNLWNMRSFYLAYARHEKLQPMVAEIGWTHNMVIIEKCKDDFEREFYLRMTRKYGWTKHVLIHQIENQAYERTLLNQTNFTETLPAALQSQAKLAIRDEYIFDFLELDEVHSERELERAILSKVDAFLRQMGGMFAFLGSQYRVEVGDQEFFIDLLLYHRRLRCLVAIDLKIGRFQPEYVGKMQFYLAVLNDQVRLDDEGSSIGIILCKSKDKTIVEYALKDSDKPIGVATYQIVSQLPQELKGQLPSPEEIAQLLEGVE